MARYIDADALVQILEAWKRDCAECDYESEAGQVIFDVICQIQDQPTADVVPRAEVASDIFAEIEELLKDTKDDYRLNDEIRGACAVRYAMTKVAALKKKYTEDSTDGKTTDR